MDWIDVCSARCIQYRPSAIHMYKNALLLLSNSVYFTQAILLSVLNADKDRLYLTFIQKDVFIPPLFGCTGLSDWLLTTVSWTPHSRQSGMSDFTKCYVLYFPSEGTLLYQVAGLFHTTRFPRRLLLKVSSREHHVQTIDSFLRWICCLHPEVSSPHPSYFNLLLYKQIPGPVRVSQSRLHHTSP